MELVSLLSQEDRVSSSHHLSYRSALSPPSLLSNVIQGILPTHLHLMPRSRMYGGLHPRPYSSLWYVVSAQKKHRLLIKIQSVTDGVRHHCT
jgi:hypothetical protein